MVHFVSTSGRVQVARPSAAYDLSCNMEFRSTGGCKKGKNGRLETSMNMGRESLVGRGSGSVGVSLLLRLYTSFTA